MSIKDFLLKIKPFYALFLLLVIMVILYDIWLILGPNRAPEPLKITYPRESLTGSLINAVTPKSEPVIGSKSGKKYYFPWCGTVKRIKPENQVHFDSIESAKRAGFTPGGNCKGLK